jgi:hypothetical protein
VQLSRLAQLTPEKLATPSVPPGTVASVGLAQTPLSSVDETGSRFESSPTATQFRALKQLTAAYVPTEDVALELVTLPTGAIALQTPFVSVIWNA